MRFHHSTRRKRNRFSQAPGSGSGAGYHGASASCGTGGKFGGHPSALSSRWAQLSYCRQTNLHFNRRLPVELPEEMRHEQLMRLVLGDRTPANTHKQHYEKDNGNTYDHDAQAQSLERLDKLSLHHQSKPHNPSNPKLILGRQGSLKVRHHSAGQRAREEAREAAAAAHQSPATEAESQAKHERLAHVTRAASREHGEEEDAEENGRRLKPTSVQKLDLESAREKLVAQVDKHPFWSNKAAKRMRLLDVTERQVYIYELTSYCEKRDLEWRFEPYRGGKLGAIAAISTQTPVHVSATTCGAQRPVLSSVSEIPATSRVSAIASGSQPGSPLRAAPAFAPARDDKLSSAAYPKRPRQGALTTRQQSIRRSCSSVASSPVHQKNTYAGAAQLTAPSSPVRSTDPGAPLSFEPPLQAPHAGSPGSLGAPRKLPSAHCVWSIEPPEHLRPALFTGYLHTSEVPGTSFLKQCHGCDGKKRLPCSSCYGAGFEACLSCAGKGSTRTYSSAFGASGGSSGGRSLGPRSERRHNNDSSSSMWDNASDAASGAGMRLGSGRYDEPGGITSGSSLASSSEVCPSCSGNGQKRCWICAGRGHITCTACAGTGTLRCFLNLNITYINHRDELCLNNSDAIIPRERLKLCTGLVLVDEVADRLAPLASSSRMVSPSSVSLRSTMTTDGATSCTQKDNDPTDKSLANDGERTMAVDAAHRGRKRQQRHLLEQLAKPTELSQLNAMSSKLLEKHAESYLRSERLIKQRHKVTQIECFKIDWEFRKKRGHFVVYGDERKVYIAKYPFKSICNIT